LMNQPGSLCMPGSRSYFLARDAQTGARFGSRQVSAQGPFLVRSPPPAGAARAAAPVGAGRSTVRLAGVSPTFGSAGLTVTSVSGCPSARRREARVGAVDSGLVAFAGGKQPGMRCPFAQPLRVMGPHKRQAVKSVGHPVFRLRDGGGRGGYLLPETHGPDPCPGQALVVDSVHVRHGSLRKCAQLDARPFASVGLRAADR